jgi:hypothetical protein
MTARTSMRWRNTAGTIVICLAGAVFFAALWFRATYHFFPGMVPTVVHWCGRDYETGDSGQQTWTQITAAEKPRQIHVVGTYPPIFGFRRPLLAPATPGARPPGPPGPGEPCAMVVYVQTGPGRFQGFSLEGGP